MGSYHLVCHTCGRSYEPGEVEYLCPACSDQQRDEACLRGVLTCVYEKPAAFPKDNWTDHRRYIDLLPLQTEKSLPPLQVGPTPLHEVKRLRQATMDAFRL